MIPRNITRCAVFIAVAATGLIVLFRGLGTEPVARWDERTNISVVQSHLDGKGFTLDGFPFLEKPGLWYIIASIAVRYLGDSPFSFRLPSAVSAIMTLCMLTYVMMKSRGTLSGIIFAVLFLTIPHLYQTNPASYFSTHTLKSADGDSLQILFLTLSFISTVHLMTYDRLVAAVAGGLFSALAFFAKGPIGLTPVIAYLLASGVRHRQHAFAFIMSALLPILLWSLIMFARHGDLFIDTFFRYHIFTRILMPIEGHAYPWWYTLQVVSDPRVFPYFILLIPAIIRVLSHRADATGRLAGVYVVTILLAATLTQTKLAWYVLPMYPFAAIVIACAADDLLGKRITGNGFRDPRWNRWD